MGQPWTPGAAGHAGAALPAEAAAAAGAGGGESAPAGDPQRHCASAPGVTAKMGPGWATCEERTMCHRIEIEKERHVFGKYMTV